MKKGLIKEEFKRTGENEVCEDFICKKWNHLWSISQYHDDYRLIKFLRKDSPITILKITIKKSQAQSIIKKLGLKKTEGNMLKNANDYKRMSDMIALRDWRIKKHGLNKYTNLLA